MSSTTQEQPKRAVSMCAPTASVGGTANVWLAGFQGVSTNGYRPNFRGMKVVRVWISGNVTVTGAAGSSVDAEFYDRNGSVVLTESLDRTTSGWAQSVNEAPGVFIEANDFSTPGWLSILLVGVGTGTATNVVVGFEVELVD